jgi:hypothetical protein
MLQEDGNSRHQLFELLPAKQDPWYSTMEVKLPMRVKASHNQADTKQTWMILI